MTNLLSYLWRVVLIAGVVLLVREFLIGPIVGTSGGDSATVKLSLTFLSLLLMTSALAYPVARSRLRGWRLVGAVFLALFGLNVFLLQIEAVVFLNITRAEVMRGSLTESIQSALLSLLLVVTLGMMGPPTAAGDPKEQGFMPWPKWLWRFVLCSVVYVILYFVAGILIFPFVRDFYESQNLRVEPGFLFVLQFFRGALYVAVVLPLIRTMPVGRLRAGLAVGFLFAILAGLAPLLLPNSLMPASVRYFHMIEIGWSNFLFGMLAGYLFGLPKKLLT